MCDEDGLPSEKVVEVLEQCDNGHNCIFPASSWQRKRSEAEIGTKVKEKESRRIEDVYESK